MNGEKKTAKGEENLWESATEDLEKQREMLKKEAEKGESKDVPATKSEVAIPEKSVVEIKLDRILDIPFTLSVELGDTRMLINDLLQLGQGSVIELAKLVGEPLDVLVNNKLVARGEVVVVNEKFGVRLTEVISSQERIENLT